MVRVTGNNEPNNPWPGSRTETLSCRAAGFLEVSGAAMKKYPRKQNGSKVTGWLRRGFTLVEILIVVIILGILAAIALPAFSNTSKEAKENMLRENLRVLRTQLGAYRAQHRDVSPGYPAGNPDGAATEATFIEQMTNSSNPDGDTGAANRPYGPYLREMPKNPLNDKAEITILGDGDAFPAAADNSSGWYYRPDDNTWKANCIDDMGVQDYYNY